MDEINHQPFCLEMINGNGEESRLMKRYSLGAATILEVGVWVYWRGGGGLHINTFNSAAAQRHMTRNGNGGG